MKSCRIRDLGVYTRSAHDMLTKHKHQRPWGLNALFALGDRKKRYSTGPARGPRAHTQVPGTGLSQASLSSAEKQEPQNGPKTPFVFGPPRNVLKTHPETSIGPLHPFLCLLSPPLLCKITIMLIFLYGISVLQHFGNIQQNMWWAVSEARTLTNSIGVR